MVAGEKLDPRAAIAGRYISQEPANTSASASSSNQQSSPGQHAYWESGLFDKDSWIEAQSGWARSVVTGRARLGGVPCGKLLSLPPYAMCGKPGLGVLGTRGGGRGKGARLPSSCLFPAAVGGSGTRPMLLIVAAAQYWEQASMIPWLCVGGLLLLPSMWEQESVCMPMA